MPDESASDSKEAQLAKQGSWRLLSRRTLNPSHHVVGLLDAGAPDAIPDASFSDSGISLGPRGVLVTTASDVAVQVTVGVGRRPRRGTHIGDVVLDLGSEGVEICSPPEPGEDLIDWPSGRTDVAILGPSGNIYERRWVTFALTPRDAAAPHTEDLPNHVERLTKRLANQTAQAAAIESLRRIGTPAIPRLIELLLDKAESPEARYGAGCALGRIGGSQVVDPLLAALSDRDVHVRRGAATGFRSLSRKYSDERVRLALTRSLQDHADRVDWLSAMALAELGDARVIPALVTLAQGPHTDVVDAAFYALAGVGDESLLPFIERVINGEDGRDYGLLTPNVRLAARRAKAAITARASPPSR
jgi:hypothetical protein